MSRITPLIGLALLTACHSDDSSSPSPADNHGETISVVSSEVFTITLETVGSGEYISPPRISSPAVQFLVVVAGAPGPNGSTQRFRFQAVQSGRAVITFLHKGQSPTVQDTVVVQ
ncbi:MAG TPA: hypothetical protein VFN08_20010 [Gemmatimonadales bacterium]|jgi:hypothetical protein|nr:hypothetical protein [Gemmatimonadales bacterium]